MADKLKGGIIGGSTDLSIPVILRKTTDNKELKGVLDASILCSYWRQGGVWTSIACTSLAAANSAHADGGWVEVNSISMPGVYRLDPPDAAVASAADWVVIAAMPNGATSGYLWVQEYTLTGDPASSIGFGVINIATASLIAAVATLSTTINATAASLALTAYDGLIPADLTIAVASLAAYITSLRVHEDAIAASLALTAYDPPTLAEMNALAASLALTAYAPLTATQGNALAASLALTAYDAVVPADLAVAVASLAAYVTSLRAHEDLLAASTALAAYDPPTKGEMDTGFAALNDITVAEVWAKEIDTLTAPSLALTADDALMWVVSYISGDIAKASTTFAYKDGAGATLWSNDVQPTARTRS